MAERFDVCVVGTGAGGGVMIQELTEAGFRVVALQRGPYLTTADFLNNDELEVTIRDSLFSPDQVETWRPDEATAALKGRYNYMAHCVGGTMTHWAGWAWRFRPDDFKVLSREGPLEGGNARAEGEVARAQDREDGGLLLGAEDRAGERDGRDLPPTRVYPISLTMRQDRPTRKERGARVARWLRARRGPPRAG